MSLRYVHKSDDSPCDPPRVTGVPPQCTVHGRLVRMVAERETATPYLEQIRKNIEAATNVPTYLFPAEHETSGFQHRLNLLQIDLVQEATRLAMQHGFRPDLLEVTVSLRLPPKPEEITIQVVKAEKHLYVCEHQRFITRCEKGCHDSACYGCGAHLEQCAQVMGNGGQPCCTQCEHPNP